MRLAFFQLLYFQLKVKNVYQSISWGQALEMSNKCKTQAAENCSTSNPAGVDTCAVTPRVYFILTLQNNWEAKKKKMKKWWSLAKICQPSFFLMFIYLFWEREFQAVSLLSALWLEPMNPEITWAEARSRMLTQLSHLGTPPNPHFKKNHKWKFAEKTKKTCDNINKRTCFVFIVWGKKIPSSLI